MDGWMDEWMDGWMPMTKESESNENGLTYEQGWKIKYQRE